MTVGKNGALGGAKDGGAVETGPRTVSRSLEGGTQTLLATEDCPKSAGKDSWNCRGCFMGPTIAGLSEADNDFETAPTVN